MEIKYCAYCKKRRDICDLNSRQVMRYKRFEQLYFCKDSDCYACYLKAHQSLSQIKRAQANTRNYSHKHY